MCSLIKYPEYMYIKKAIFPFKFTLVTIFSSWFYMSKYIYTAHACGLNSKHFGDVIYFK